MSAHDHHLFRRPADLSPRGRLAASGLGDSIKAVGAVGVVLFILLARAVLP